MNDWSVKWNALSTWNEGSRNADSLRSKLPRLSDVTKPALPTLARLSTTIGSRGLTAVFGMGTGVTPWI